jgi:hypothetical protein
MKEFEFEYKVIVPKQKTIEGKETVKSLFYWTAYWQLRSKLKKQYGGEFSGTNVIIKLDYNYINI